MTNEALAWVAGLFSADGSFERGKYARLVTVDPSIVSAVCAACDGWAIPNSRKRSPRSWSVLPQYYITITNPQAVAYLTDLGLKKRKLDRNALPLIPRAQIRHFLRGYFDGDGSAWLGRDGLAYWQICGQKDFLQEVLCEVNARFSTRVKKLRKESSTTKSMKLRFSGRKAMSLTDWMYSGASFYSQRKIPPWAGHGPENREEESVP